MCVFLLAKLKLHWTKFPPTKRQPGGLYFESQAFVQGEGLEYKVFYILFTLREFRPLKLKSYLLLVELLSEG